MDTSPIRTALTRSHGAWWRHTRALSAQIDELRLAISVELGVLDVDAESIKTLDLALAREIVTQSTVNADVKVQISGKAKKAQRINISSLQRRTLRKTRIPKKPTDSLSENHGGPNGAVRPVK